MTLKIGIKNVLDEQLQILDEEKLHTRLRIPADEMRRQVQKIEISSNISPFEPKGLQYAIIGPWFSEILTVANIEGSIGEYNYSDDPDPQWHILKFNIGDHLRNARIDDCANIIKVFGYSALSLRQGLYLAMLGLKPDFGGLGMIGLSLAATVLRPPRVAVLYHFADGKKTVGDHWPSYREPFLQVPFGKIAFS